MPFCKVTKEFRIHSDNLFGGNADADKVECLTDTIAAKIGRYSELAEAIVAGLLETQHANREVDESMA
jgi:hypothetical protein